VEYGITLGRNPSKDSHSSGTKTAFRRGTWVVGHHGTGQNHSQFHQCPWDDSDFDSSPILGGNTGKSVTPQGGKWRWDEVIAKILAACFVGVHFVYKDCWRFWVKWGRRRSRRCNRDYSDVNGNVGEGWWRSEGGRKKADTISCCIMRKTYTQSLWVVPASVRPSTSWS
jgi:hypothetical protein